MSLRATAVLERGASLIAGMDVIFAIIAITACSRTLVDLDWISSDISSMSGRASADTLFFMFKFVMGITLVVASFYLIFGIILLVGVQKESTSLVNIWIWPNLIVILIGLVMAFGLAFTRSALMAMVFPGMTIFRSFETWIVREYYWELEDSKDRHRHAFLTSK